MPNLKLRPRSRNVGFHGKNSYLIRIYDPNLHHMSKIEPYNKLLERGQISIKKLDVNFGRRENIDDQLHISADLSHKRNSVSHPTKN